MGLGGRCEAEWSGGGGEDDSGAWETVRDVFVAQASWFTRRRGGRLMTSSHVP